MDKDVRLDHIVGLIYEVAHDATSIGPLVDAITNTVERRGTTGAGRLGHATAIKAYVKRSVLSHSRHSQAKPPQTEPDSATPTPWRAQTDALLARLSTHLIRSSRLQERMRLLQGQQWADRTELAELPFAIVWVDADLHVLSSNHHANALFKKDLGLTVRNHQLHPWVPSDKERLDHALRMATTLPHGKRQRLAIRQKRQDLPLLTTIIPIASDTGVTSRQGPFALVVMQDANATVQLGMDHLRSFYDLTTAEFKLAKALANNETLEEYADGAGISRNTARSHLTRVFAKTRTSRQAELVRLLMLAHAYT